MYQILISLGGIGLLKFGCRELGQYLMQFDALEKKCSETTNYSI